MPSSQSRWFINLFEALVVVLLVLMTSPPVFGHEGDHDLQEQANGNCEPNTDLTGYTCQNITLYETEIHNNSLRVWANFNTSFDSTEDIFVTQIWIYVWFLQFNNSLWAEFEFNSTTPNNTVLASGQQTIGQIDLPASEAGIPEVSANVETTYTVILETFDCADSPSNNSFCDWGVIHAIVGFNATGSISNGTVTITATLDEPEAVTVRGPFHYSVDETLFCLSLSEEIVYNKDLAVQFEICEAEQTPCDVLEHQFNTTSWDKNTTFADNACFNHSIPFTTPPEA